MLQKSILILIFIFSSFFTYGQEEPNRISFTYGLITAPEIIDLASDVVASVVTAGNYRTEKNTSTGGLFLGYRRFLTKRFNAGFSLGYEQISKDIISGNEVEGKVNSNYYMALAEMEFNYLSREMVQLFSSLGAGIALRNENAEVDNEEESETSTFMAFQVDALGLRVGRSFGASATVGFGYKGIITAGLSYQF